VVADRGTARADADAIARRVLADGLRPVERLSPDQWAERYRVIAMGTGPHPGPWRNARTPYLVEPMAAWGERRISQLVWVFGSQMGKTEALINCVLATVCQDPAWSLLAYPSAAFARDVLADRIMPAIEATPAALGRLRGGRADRTVDKLRFDGATLNVVGSGSATEAKGRPVRDRYLDEIDEMEARFVRLQRERGKAYGDAARELAASTPTWAGEGIDELWSECQQHEWAVPCPSCRAYVALEFEQLRWGVEEADGRGGTRVRGGSRCTIEEVEQTTRWCCPRCGAAHNEHKKAWMEARGAWLTEGQSAELLDAAAAPAVGAADDGGAVWSVRAEDGDAVVVRGTREPATRVGYRASSLHSLMLPWGRVTRAYAEAGWQMTPEFVGGYLARAWEQAGERAGEEQLATIRKRSRYRLRVSDQRGQPQPAPLPEAVRLVTCGIDVQADAVYYHAMGWAAGASASYLVDWRVQPYAEVEALAPVFERLLGLGYQTADGRRLGVYAAAIDSGFRTPDVYAYAAGTRRRVWPVKGVWGGQMIEPWQTVPIERLHTGRVLRQGVQLLRVNTDAWKTVVLGAVKATASPEDAAQAATLAGREGASQTGHRLLLPADAPDEYCRHLVSEHRIKRSELRTARQRRSFRHDDGYEWRLRPGHRRNEGLDTTAYQYALAAVYRLARLGADQMDRMAAAAGPGAGSAEDGSAGRAGPDSAQRLRERLARLRR